MAIQPLTFKPSADQGSTSTPTPQSNTAIKPITFNSNNPSAGKTIFGNTSPVTTPIVKSPAGGFKIGDVISGIENGIKGIGSNSLETTAHNILGDISKVDKVISGLKISTQSAPTQPVATKTPPKQSKPPTNTVLSAFENALKYTPGIGLATATVDNAKKSIDVLNGFLGYLNGPSPFLSKESNPENAAKKEYAPQNPQQNLGKLGAQLMEGIVSGNGGVNEAFEALPGAIMRTVMSSPLGPKIAVVQDVIAQLGTDGVNKFSQLLNKLKPIDINLEDVRAVTVGNGTPEQVAKFTAATDLMEKHNISMKTIIDNAKDGSPITKIFDILKNTADAVIQTFKDTLTPAEQKLLDAGSKSPIESAIPVGTYTPGNLIQNVIDSNLENTSEGKELIQAAASASKTGDNLVVTSAEGSPLSQSGNLSDSRQQIQDIKSLSTPDDAVLNPIADQVDDIIKENEHQGIQSPSTQSQTIETIQSPNGQINKNINVGQKSSIPSEGNQITESNQGNGVNGRGESKTTISPNSTSKVPSSIGTGSGLKVSKIAKEIDAKAVEANLTKGFSQLSGYSPITIKGQADIASKLVNNHFEIAKSIVKGETDLPKDLKGVSLVTAMEDYLKQNPDAQLALDLAKSPLVTGTSQAAQELRLAAERDPYSPVEIIKRLEDDRRAVITKQAGQPVEKEITKTIKDIQKAIKAKTPTKEDWASFIQSIEC